MDKTQVEQALIERSRISTQLAEINAGYDAMLRKILTPELQAELDAINAERASATKESFDKLEELQETIKAAVLVLGETVKVPGVAMAVWNKGKTSWNTEGLGKLIDGEPEKYKFLLSYKTTGDPSVSIRGA